MPRGYRKALSVCGVLLNPSVGCVPALGPDRAGCLGYWVSRFPVQGLGKGWGSKTRRAAPSGLRAAVRRPCSQP